MMLMEAGAVWNVLKGRHVVLVDLVSISVEVLLLDQGAVSTVELTVTGPGTARQETGRISVIAVVNVATLKEIVKTVQRS